MTSKEYDLETISQAICDTISSGVSKRPFYTYIAPSEMGEVPAALVEPMEADFTGTMAKGNDVFDFVVYVIVSRADLPTAVTELSSLLSGDGPDSIRNAIYNRRNLGLTEANVQAVVLGMVKYGSAFKWYTVPHVGAQLLVRVFIN